MIFIFLQVEIIRNSMLTWILLGGDEFAPHQYWLVVTVIDNIRILAVEADCVRILQQFLQPVSAADCVFFQEDCP